MVTVRPEGVVTEFFPLSDHKSQCVCRHDKTDHVSVVADPVLSSAIGGCAVHPVSFEATQFGALGLASSFPAQFTL